MGFRVQVIPVGRLARVVVPGMPHHVTQRGNRRADVFFDVDDRELYLKLLRQYSEKHELQTWAYTLMTNHIHLVAVPGHAESLARALRDTHSTYAMHFNDKYECTGHLWQGRFYSCVLDASHLWSAVRYVERNPVRAHMVARAEDYPWSSAPRHCGRRSNDPILAKDSPLVGAIENWAAWLAEGEFEHDSNAIRQQTSTGRPCGSTAFVAQLEQHLGRNLSPRRRGPKPQKVQSDTSAAPLAPAASHTV